MRDPVPTLPRAAAGLLVLAAALVPSGVTAQATNESGGGGLIGLSLPVGARMVGQGRAAAAEYGDLHALPYNPATAAVGLDRGATTFSRFEGADAADIASNFLAAAWSSRWGTLAAHLVFHDFGEIPVTIDSPEPVGSIDVGEWVVGVTYANQWRSRLAWGATAKLYRSDLGEADGSTAVFDAGLIYRPVATVPLDVAVALRNLGPDLEYESEGTATPARETAFRLPGRIRLGLAWRPDALLGLPATYTIAFAADVEADIEEVSTTSFHSGVAATLAEVAILRAGLLVADNPFVQSGDEGREVGGSFGVGVRFGGFEADIAREVSVSELGDETHFSVGYRF